MGGGPAAGAFGPLATWGERVIATLIDFAIIFVFYIVLFIVGIVLSAISHVLGALFLLVGYLAVVVYALYIAYLNGSKGATPGKALTGLKVISEETGQLIGGGMGIVRQFAHIVDGIICDIGYLFPLWDAKKQTLADKIMKTVVVSGQPKQSFGADIFKS